MTSYFFQDVSCAVPNPLLSISRSGLLVTTLNDVQSICRGLSASALNHVQSICRGLLASALTHVQSKYGDLTSVTALPDCQSTSQGLSIVLALTSVQSIQCHMPSLEGILSVSNSNESTYSLINEMYILNCYIKISYISDHFNQPTLCLYPAEFGLLEYISLENPNLVLVVRKLAVYSFKFWNFFLDIWIDFSLLFCFVQELCHKIIVENQNFMTNWQFQNLTEKNSIYLCNLFFQRHLYSKHDFVAAIRNLFKNIIAYRCQYPRYINFKSLRLMFQPKQKTRRHWQCLYIFRLHRRSLPITGIIKQRTRYLNAQMDLSHLQKKLSSSQKLIGGHGARIFSYQFLEPYITSNISTTAHFRFVDHVDNIKILEFPESEYIHAAIPLYALFELLPVVKARKVASIHGFSAGSRCNQAQLLDATVNHSCLACTTHSSIFVPDKNSAQLHVDNVVKSRKKQDQKLTCLSGPLRCMAVTSLNLLSKL